MFRVRSITGAIDIFAENPEVLESTIRRHQGVCGMFQVDLILDIPLTAVVVRHDGEPDTVYLASGGKTVGLRRDTDATPGDLGVSCPPSGKAVGVRTLNVKFAEVTDPYTDRGIVWVTPGEPATAFFFVKSSAAIETGRIWTIAKAVLQELDRQVLRHFTTPAGN